jgi:serine/threonine protein kinase
MELLLSGSREDVYKARDHRLGRVVAIKVRSESTFRTAELRENFDREARAVSTLDRPGICRAFDVGYHGGFNYAIPEY